MSKRDKLRKNSVRLKERIDNKSKIDSKNNVLPYLAASTSSIPTLKLKSQMKRPEIKIKPFLKLKNKNSSQNNICRRCKYW